MREQLPQVSDYRHLLLDSVGRVEWVQLRTPEDSRERVVVRDEGGRRLEFPLDRIRCWGHDDQGLRKLLDAPRFRQILPLGSYVTYRLWRKKVDLAVPWDPDCFKYVWPRYRMARGPEIVWEGTSIVELRRKHPRIERGEFLVWREGRWQRVEDPR